jgi:hypothetical protein
MNNNKINITDADLDSIIASIESTIADMTSGNNAIKKAEEDDDMDEKQKEEALAEEMEQAMQNKGQEMQAPEQKEEALAEEMEQAMQNKGQEMQAPKQEEKPQDNSMEENLDQPLSDDELREVYSAMPIDELEKHFMIIREILQSKGGEGSEEQAPAPEAPAPAPEAPAMKSENQNSNLSKSQKDKEIALLKAQLNEQTKTLALLTKAFATLAKPERKAITQIAELGYIAKSEASDMQKSLTHEEMSQMYKKLGPSSFSKSENTVIMGYFLKGINKNEAEKILLTKGGKQ